MAVRRPPFYRDGRGASWPACQLLHAAAGSFKEPTLERFPFRQSVVCQLCMVWSRRTAEAEVMETTKKYGDQVINLVLIASTNRHWSSIHVLAHRQAYGFSWRYLDGSNSDRISSTPAAGGMLTGNLLHVVAIVMDSLENTRA